MNRRGLAVWLWLLFFPIGEAQEGYRPYIIENRSGVYSQRLTQANKSSMQELEDYNVTFYFLDLEATNTSTYISGNTTIGAVPTGGSLGSFVFELSSNLSIDSVLVNDIKHSFIRSEDKVTVNLITAIPSDIYFSVQIFYKGTVSIGGFFAGMGSASDPSWGNWVTWTLSEPYSALDWFPCKQDLADKADSVYVFITTDNSLMAGSNGILTDVVTLPGNKVRYEWKSYHPIAYYLISISVADYQDYSIYAHPEGLSDSILIQNFIYDNPNYLSQNRSAIDMTAELIELYSSLFVMYPFYNEKYGHCLAPIGGGMEHQTMTTLSNFSFHLVAHELGHMWFGDYVTCATWMDIWINEGFASYTEYIAYQNLYWQGDADIWMLNAQSRALNEPEGSVYVPFEEINNVGRIFNGNLSYKKGAALIHMIRYELDNDSIFFLTIRNYLDQFGDSVATGLDFRDVLESTSGQDFTHFFDQWYFGKGYPIFNFLWSQNQDTVIIRSKQTTSSGSTPLFKTSLDFLLIYDGGDTLVRVYQDENVQEFNFIIPYQINSIMVDPDSWLVKQVSGISYDSDFRIDKSQLFMIWPNPAGDQLNVKFENIGWDHLVTISDLSGKIHTRVITRDNQIQLPLDFLPQGIFLIKVDEYGRQSVQKFVKNK